MEKKIIEVVLQPETKTEKESIFLLLFHKKRFILFITLIGILAGLIVSPVYYLRENRLANERANELSNVPPVSIISENLFDRQFLIQPTREREPGNLHISKQLRYDVFLLQKTMNDIIIHCFKSEYTAEKTSFETFLVLSLRKLAIDNSSQFQSVNLGSFTTEIDSYITQNLYLLANDDKNTLKIKIQENQSILDRYNLAVLNNTININSAQILIDIESLIQENKILEELIKGSTANDPDPRGTQIAAAQIDALCETLDEVKLELLTMIDKYTAPAPSIFNAVAIGVIFPCMAFIVAVLLALLSDWRDKLVAEQSTRSK